MKACVVSALRRQRIAVSALRRREATVSADRAAIGAATIRVPLVVKRREVSILPVFPSTSR